MTANNSKSCIGYFKKLIHEYHNTYHRSIGKNFTQIIILWLKKLNQVIKLLNLKLVIRARITKYNIQNIQNIFRQKLCQKLVKGDDC